MNNRLHSVDYRVWQACLPQSFPTKAHFLYTFSHKEICFEELTPWDSSLYYFAFEGPEQVRYCAVSV